jgi:hypothetical protein
VGTNITINGSNLIAAGVGTTVAFNGVAALIASASSTQIVAAVPAGATSGPISITANGQGAISSNAFNVIPPGNSAATLSIVSVSSEPSVINQIYSVQTAITATSGVATGTIVVYQGQNFCTIDLPATSCFLAGEEYPGEYTINAYYYGDETRATASASVEHIVNPAAPTEMCGLDPWATQTDPAGFVPITQLSGIVYTPGIVQDITNNGNLSVAVTSPGINATITDSVVDVVGTFVGPTNTGITVNGVVAATTNGTFLAANVPLSAGMNTLTVTATTLPGAVATTTVPVTQAGPISSPLIFNVDGPKGSSLPAPATIAFDIAIGALPNNAIIQTISIDVDGDGTYDYSAGSLDMLPASFMYTKPGLYIAGLQVLDGNGNIYNAHRYVLIESISAERAMLCDVYGYLKDRLNAQDAVGASSAYQPLVSGQYQQQFMQIGANMPLAATMLGHIANGRIAPTYAELTLVRDNADQTRSGYPMRLTQGSDGVWRISEM